MIKRAYYQSSILMFLAASQDEILGELTNNHHFALDIMQKNAWIEQITNLKGQLQSIPNGDVFFEFAIPRMGKRVDVLLLIEGVVFVVEYKTGAKTHDKHATDQAMDYALDLKNFHEGSHHKHIVPILVSTKAALKVNSHSWFRDRIASPLFSNGNDLGEVIKQALTNIQKNSLISTNSLHGFSDTEQDVFGADDWADSGYKPTPTIVEAAQALYQGHSVEDISRSDAGAKNLTHTANCITEIIDYSRSNRKKSICFVTGVPGAGKTLAGLNISTQKFQVGSDEHAVFLSGNGPLVIVLREALARDEVVCSKVQGERLSKKEATSRVSAFIQNIHHFRDDALKSEDAPIEHVVVFDEAQRAWNQKEAQKFMETKRGVASFAMSEPEFLIGVMDRKEDWCTIICLIGGGQEINQGEAGLVEWFNALQKSFPHWDVYYSDQITHKNYSWGQDLAAKLSGMNSEKKDDLHLAVSVRSYRAEKLSDFVGTVIDGDLSAAQKLYSVIKENYPLVLTRDLTTAREWLKGKARGTERYGLVASSGGNRLKPEGLHVKNKIDPAVWFLNDKDDIRSSYYLEDIATEFDIQGLELDYTGICWDADFRREGNEWGLYLFKGTKWQNVNDENRRVYIANAYRVLLTRARQGMVIFVPNGDERDYTRPPKFYDETYEFLKACGLEGI